MVNFVRRLFGKGKALRISPQDRDRLVFEQQARNQLLKLKKKGLGIPVFMM